MGRYEYDLVVIGSGPGGQKAAIQAAKLGKRVALIDLNPMVGGVCLHDGTIPSKSFREAILHLSGYRVRSHFGSAYRVKQNISMQDLTTWSSSIITEVEQTLRAQLMRNNVEIICGFGSFEDEHHVKVSKNNAHEILSTEYVVIATGTRPRRPEGFEFDNNVILDSNGILYMDKIPRTITIVGGGVIGCEYGSMFAALGVEVTIVEAREKILAFTDNELRDTLTYELKSQRAKIILNEKVVKCLKAPDGRAVTYLDSGKRLVSEVLLVSAGRSGNVSELNLDRVGVKYNENGIIQINESFQTSVENVYAVGDVTGFPALASTSIDQGRRAACHAFGLEDPFPSLPLPLGIYSIPEIAMVGKTESELTAAKVPYEVGLARFDDIERGKIVGDTRGLLKILFNRESHEILGVHIIGEAAIELIHIGQAVMATNGNLELLVHMVFNYPSLSQAYKVAALDGFNKIVDTRFLPAD